MLRLRLDPAERAYVEQVLALCAREDSPEGKALRCAERGLSATRSPKQVTVALLHAARVAGILSQEFKTSEPEVIVAALLHDVLAEGSTEVEEIEREFGDTVADYVVLLTPPRFFPKAERARLYAEGLVSAPEQVLIIKLAEIYDDIRFRRLRQSAATRLIMSQILDRIVRQRRLRSATRTAIERVQQLLRVSVSNSQLHSVGGMLSPKLTP